MDRTIDHRPRNPNEMVLISALQNLVMDETSKKSILKEGNTGIRPKFGQTMLEKIILHERNPFFMNRIISLIFSLPVYAFAISSMSRLSMIYKNRPLKAIFSNIISASSIRPGCTFLLKLGVIYVISELMKLAVSVWVLHIVARDWKNKLTDMSILPALVRQNRWWDTKEGRDCYNKRKDYDDIGLHIYNVAHLSLDHAERVFSKEQEKSGLLVHVWNPNFSYVADQLAESETGSKYEQREKLDSIPICTLCMKHVKDTVNAK